MEVLKFKTNIKCSGCVAQVTDALNATAGTATWEVDVTSPEKLLTIVDSKATENDIIASVKAAGFTAERVN